MQGPQPVEAREVTSATANRTSPLLHLSGGEIPDAAFRAAMTACALLDVQLQHMDCRAPAILLVRPCPGRS